MITEEQTTEKKDEALWRLAKKRAAFKKSLVIYVLVNSMLWAIWYFTDNDHYISRYDIPWPIWSTVFWGFGIAFQYAESYLFPGTNSAEREYQKLKDNQSKN